jgi:flagellar basal body-associated protein FliL
MDDGAIVLVLLVVTFVMGAIVALFIGAIVLERREKKRAHPAERVSSPAEQSQPTPPPRESSEVPR